VTKHEIPDELGRFCRDTLANLYNLDAHLIDKVAAKEFVDMYVAPTRDTGSPSSREVEFELEEARKAGISAQAAALYSIRVGCALVGEAQRYRFEGDVDSGWLSVANANYFVGLILGGMPDSDRATVQHRDVSIKGAIARHAKNPRQREKSFIRQCWTDWQMKPDAYASKAAFARDMMSKCEHLTSPKVVEDWCREWDKEKHHRAGKLSIERAD
jgi:hypothetical protein